METNTYFLSSLSHFFLEWKIFQTVVEQLETHIKFYSHQLMHFLIQICIGLLSYIKST